MKILQKGSIDSERGERLLFILFMIIGIAARIWRFGDVPGGINQDEAYAAYEAYSLLHYGVDSNGYVFPVYLEAWGSGMNVLNTYLMIPFIAVFGLKSWVIRMPQLIIACFSLWVVYLLAKKIWNGKAALCVLFLMAIAPWHIMLSRWGLESNLAPGFILFGLYFFLCGLEKKGFFVLSAFMYGLSLYCYATIWPIVPLILVMQIVYCIIYKKLSFSKELVLSAVLLFVMAVPLLLFLLVNRGVIGEITLPFLSIPRLAHMRTGEVSFSNIIPNFNTMIYILKHQTDGLIWNVIDKYGIFYLFTFPFFIMGLLFYIVRIGKKLWKKEFAPEVFVLIQFAAGLLLGCLVEVYINRINIIFIPMIVIAATGIYFLCEMTDLRLLLILLVVYGCSFVGFEKEYFTDYDKQLSKWFAYGMEEALEEATSHEGTIYVDALNAYARILYLEQIPVTDYLESVELIDYPGGARDIVSFERYRFFYDRENLDMDGIYLLEKDVDMTPYPKEKFLWKEFENYVVAVPIKK